MLEVKRDQYKVGDTIEFSYGIHEKSVGEIEKIESWTATDDLITVFTHDGKTLIIATWMIDYKR